MTQLVESIINAKDLPSPPGIALKMMELYSQPNVNVEELAAVIAADPVLSSKLIAYCNSPLLGRKRQTTSVQQAVVVVGLRAVKIMALSFSIVRTRPANGDGFDYDQFWNRSLATAVVAREIATLSHKAGDEEFLLGIMIEIGRVGMAHTFPAEYNDLVQESAQTGQPLTELEEETWGINHVRVSAELLQKWNFPENLTAAAKAYADSLGDQSNENEFVRVLALARQIVDMLFSDDLQQDEVDNARLIAAKWYRLDPAEFGEFLDRATDSWGEFAKLLKFDTSKIQSFEQLETRARHEIAQISMSLHTENTAMYQENAELKVNALVDSLTGLKNRRAYKSEAPAEWERAIRKKRPFVAMMIDIDHFKKLNDQYGHAFGDKALILFAEQLTRNARPFDSVYRWGGEEFVVLLNECDPASSHTVAERYRKSIMDLGLKHDGKAVKLTASFGLAVENNPPSGSLESLLKDADDQLYEAKSNGRNRVCSNVQPPIMPTQGIGGWIKGVLGNKV